MGADDELALWLQGSYDRAYRTAWLILHNSADAEEAVQEAYLKVWRFRHALPPGDGMRPWFYRVLVNASISLLRRERPRRDAVTKAAAQAATAEPARSPERDAIDAEAAGAVLEALADLPEYLRLPVVLRYWSGLTEREIATAVQRRPGTVKSRLHEAKRRLAADPRLAAHRPDLAEGAL
jgi:RNA polymerase sigma-70 factor (ECF subfamily)